MINPKNSLVLALTKLKTRKTRTIVTVVISSLMFAVILLALVLFDGVYNVSIAKFAEGTLASRNMVEVGTIRERDYKKMKETIEKHRAEIDKKVEEEVAKRKRRAKELGILFDEKSTKEELRPYYEIDGDGLFPKMRENDLAEEFYEYKKWNFEELFAQVKKLAVDDKFPEPYLRMDTGASEQRFVKEENGKYDFYPKKADNDIKNMDEPEPGSWFKPFHLSLTPKEIYGSYLYKQHKWKKGSGTVPILLPVNELEKLLGLKKLPDKASAKEQMARLREVHEKSAGMKMKFCAMNNLASEQVMRADSYAKMKDKDKEMIELAYARPVGCQLPAVIKDKRSKEEKKQLEAQKRFDKEFYPEKEHEPVMQEITFEVVGAMPATALDIINNGNVVDGVLRLVMGMSSLSNVVPIEMVAEDETLKMSGLERIYDGWRFKDGNLLSKMGEQTLVSFYLEYGNAEKVIETIENNDCARKSMGDNRIMDSDMAFDDYGECRENNPFRFQAFGSRAADMITVKEGFLEVMKVIGAVVAIIAGIIMMGTVGRLIADSRRETAVFRAIGFRRFDIYAVYLCYGGLISALIVLVTGVLAFMVAGVINKMLAEEVTAKMIYLYNLQDESLKFSLIGVNWLYIGVVVAVILLVGIVGVTLPILRNIRRNPIKDMRDE